MDWPSAFALSVGMVCLAVIICLWATKDAP